MNQKKAKAKLGAYLGGALGLVAAAMTPLTMGETRVSLFAALTGNAVDDGGASILLIGGGFALLGIIVFSAIGALIGSLAD